MTPALLTVAEVAERLRVSIDTVRRRYREGKLKVTRVGRQIRISERDLQQFLRKGR